MGMQMEREQTVTKLLELAKTEGIVFALYGVFGNAVRVLLPVSAKACNTELDELEFSVRASNALKRAGIFTVGQAVDLIAGDGLLRIRNLGRKTQNEIKTRLLAFGYDRLDERDRKKFWIDTLERNQE